MPAFTVQQQLAPLSLPVSLQTIFGAANAAGAARTAAPIAARNMRFMTATLHLRSGNLNQLQSPTSNPSDQLPLLRVALGFGFREVQVRLVIGMLGALCIGEQSFDRQQLETRELLSRRALAECTRGCVLPIPAAGCCSRITGTFPQLSHQQSI